MLIELYENFRNALTNDNYEYFSSLIGSLDDVDDETLSKLNSLNVSNAEIFALFHIVFESDNLKIDFLNKKISSSDDIDALRALFLCEKYIFDHYGKKFFSTWNIKKSLHFTRNLFFEKLELIKSNLGVTAPALCDKKLNKVVFVSGFIVDKRENSHLAILKNAAKSLLKINPDIEVYLALTGEKTVKTIGGWQWLGRNTVVFQDEWEKLTGRKGFLYESLNIHTTNNKITDFIRWVDSIRPDCFVMHGNVTESSYTMHALSSIYPIVYYPSNVKNKPSVNVDSIVVRSDDMWGKLENSIEDGSCQISKSSMERLDFPIHVDNDFYINRIKKSFNQQKVFSIVLGRSLVSSYFLKLNPKDVLRFFSFFEESNISLHIVGDLNFNELGDRYELVKELLVNEKLQITQRIPEDELDVYLHSIDLIFTLPELSGGGAALTKAILQGTPVICGFDNDASINCSENFMFEDLSGLLTLLRKFSQQPDMLEQCYKSNYFKILNRSDDMAHRKLYNLILNTNKKKVGAK